MDSATQTTREFESRGSAEGRDEELRHRPFRSWALQQDLISLLGNEPVWEGERDPPSFEADQAKSTEEIRGQAFLREELQNNPEFGLRSKTCAALWGAALITNALNQWGPSGLEMDSSYFAISFIAIAIGFSICAFVFPLLKPRAFVVVERCVVTYAFVIIAFQCSVTGGADSPFVLWVIFAVFYAAYFMKPRDVFFETTLGVIVAIAPIVYEPSEASTNAALFAFLMAAVSAATAYAVFYRRQLSRVAERAVRFLALADPLTSVANLRSFEHFADFLINSGTGRFSIAMVDMNGLKGANTVFGYDVGDDMVVRLSRLMIQASETEDQVARIGGDEFAVLIPSEDPEAAKNWRARFENAMATHNEHICGRLPQISVAIGTAVFPEDGKRVDELIDVADRRMYAQKSPAVTPPHVLEVASPVGALRLLNSGQALVAPKRVFNREEHGTQAGIMWLITGTFVFSWPLLPGAVVPYPTATVLLGFYCWLIAVISFASRSKSFRHYGWRIADIATLTIAAPGLWLTAGSESPFQLAGILVVAYYAQFYRGKAAFWRIATVIGLYSFAFWTSGDVSPAGETLFITVVMAEFVIATILQINSRAIDRSLAMIRESATRDALTGTRNLHAFRGDLAIATADGDTEENSHLNRPALILADLDNFRDINTQAGHSGGDAILRESARRLETACAKNGTIYRIGGDEFAILFTVDRFSDAAAIADRCRRALNFQPPEHLGIKTPVAASIGYSVLRDGMSGAKFVNAVEAALAESKASHGDSVAADTSVLL